jgi:hypothetical protein
MYRMIARPNSDELIFASRQGGGQPFAVRIDGQQFQASAALRGGELQRSGEAQQQQGRTCHPYQIQHPNAGQTQLCLARSIEVDWGRYPAFANGGAGISNLVTQGLQGFPLQIHTQKSGGQTLFKMTVQSVQATELQAGQVSLPEGTEILTEEEWRQQMKKSLQEQKQKEQEHQQK